MGHWDTNEHSEATISKYDAIYAGYQQRIEEVKQFDPLLLRYLSISYYADWLTERSPLGNKQHIERIIRFKNAGKDRKRHR